MPTALIVDDEPNIRRMVGALLASEGFEVRDAPEGALALERARESEPDVVLLDLMMPELDGLQAAVKIREEAPDALIVMLSSRESRAAANVAVSSGAHLFIEKHDVAGVADRLIDLVQAHRV